MRSRQLNSRINKFACKARDELDPDFLIIARTDTCHELGLEEAVSRINLCRRSWRRYGTTIPRTNKEAVAATRLCIFRWFAMQSRGNRDDRPLFSRNQLEEMGYAMCIDAQIMLLVSYNAQRQMLKKLRDNGDFTELSKEENVTIRKEIENIINLEDYYNVETMTVEK